MASNEFLLELCHGDWTSCILEPGNELALGSVGQVNAIFVKVIESELCGCHNSIDILERTWICQLRTSCRQLICSESLFFQVN